MLDAPCIQQCLNYFGVDLLGVLLSPLPKPQHDNLAQPVSIQTRSLDPIGWYSHGNGFHTLTSTN